MTTPSPLATAIAEEIASQLLTEGVAYEFPRSETIKVALPVIQRHLTPLIEKVERQQKAIALAVGALEKECSKFNFPDEDRPILHEALSQIHTLLKP